MIISFTNRATNRNLTASEGSVASDLTLKSYTAACLFLSLFRCSVSFSSVLFRPPIRTHHLQSCIWRHPHPPTHSWMNRCCCCCSTRRRCRRVHPLPFSRPALLILSWLSNLPITFVVVVLVYLCPAIVVVVVVCVALRLSEPMWLLLLYAGVPGTPLPTNLPTPLLSSASHRSVVSVSGFVFVALMSFEALLPYPPPKDPKPQVLRGAWRKAAASGAGKNLDVPRSVS